MAVCIGSRLLWNVAFLLRAVVAWPILDVELYCLNSSYRIPTGGGDVVVDAVGSAMACDSRTFGMATTCCNSEDVLAVLEHLHHSQQFILRHLSDRQAFGDQYRTASLGEHPCAAAGEAMLQARIFQLDRCRLISEDVMDLLVASVKHLLCAACRGGSHLPGVTAEFSKSLLETEMALASSWAILSHQVTDAYSELRQHDAAVTAGLRQAGLDGCVLEYVESQRRGLQAPAAHAIPLRNWRPGDSHGFRDVWIRWIDGLVGISAELPESIVGEVDGLLLALYHAVQPDNPAKELLVAPAETTTLVSSWPTAMTKTLGIPVASSQHALPAQVAMLVVMPNAGTDLRFDFASDPLTLDPSLLQAHVDALIPLLSLGQQARLVVVSSNPEQASALAQRLTGTTAQVQVLWRRYALFQPDPIAMLYAADSSSGSRGAPRVIVVFEVPPGGDVMGLASASKAVATGAAIASPLRVAATSHWPSLVATVPRSLLLQRPSDVSQSSCPALARLLASYLDFHKQARHRIQEGDVGRVLVYRCSALGFCGGHGDRLNGLLGVFLLALASQRAFFIDSPRPVAMHTLLSPRRHPPSCRLGGEFLLDWRMHGAVAAQGRRLNYNDRYNDLVADIPHLIVEETAPVMVIHSNQRITIPLLKSAEARSILGKTVTDALLQTPYLHADLLELLFEPTPLLALRYQRVSQAARLDKKRLIAVHFRAGNRSPDRWTDPARHQMTDLDQFLACAAFAEQRLGWKDNEVVWFLAADTAEVASIPRVAELISAGKVTLLPDGYGDASVMHLDRTPQSMAVKGLTDTWAHWLTIAGADAAVLSTSGFGVTASEAGRVRHAFLGSHGCLDVDLTAP